MRNIRSVLVVTLLSVVIASCGGGTNQISAQNQNSTSGGTTEGGTGGTNPSPTYTVSGTISGMTGSGLVILNNGKAVTVTNNAFSVSMASGSAYAFTVGTQPNGPTQQCTITNGTGTVASSNITNVAVSCSTMSYSVSGTITGLSGSGLAILNNGTPVSVSNNTFSVTLASGSTYSFTVGTQPSNPSQLCTIANGTGTVGSSNITNVAVSCTTSITPSYTVSGTISGLTGSGLVILNNGSSVSVSNNAFSVSLASGSSYAFTVGTQPSSPTQQCTIANGAGTVGTANITNVAVSCSTTSYTVSGTISGLTGSGLVILNNGKAVNVVNSAFSVTLASGSTYAFTVGTQPSSPTQQCTIANGAGTVGSANITNVAVSCSTTATNGSVTLKWTAPMTRADGTAISLSEIGGYILNYGTSPTTTNSNTITINDSNVTQYTLTLPSGTYYFVISAVDTSGTPGLKSPVLQKTL